MKKIVYFILLIGVFSCSDNDRKDDGYRMTIHENKKFKASKHERWVLKADFTVNGFNYQIIEIDGQEYLSSNYGGITPLNKSK